MADEPVNLQSHYSSLEEVFSMCISSKKKSPDGIFMTAEHKNGEYIINFIKFTNSKKSKSLNVFCSKTFQNIISSHCTDNILTITDSSGSHDVEFPSSKIANNFLLCLFIVVLKYNN